MKKYLIPIIVVIIIVILVAVFYKPAPKETIKIGAILPLSGEASAYGNYWQKAIELAVEKIEKKYNASVDVIYEDSQMNPSKAVTAAQKLININTVKAIVVGTSRETLAIAPITEEKKILLMSAGNAAEITDSGDYVFRIYPSSIYQGRDLADIAIKKGYTEKIAVLTMLDDYGVGLSNTFKEKIEESGGEVLIESFPQEGAVDFRTQLTKIKTARPEALLIIAPENVYPLILKQAKELNIDIPLLASETFQSQSVLDEAQELSEGVLFATFVEAETKEYKDFLEAHKEKYAEEPGPFSGGFYDNAALVLEALIKNNGNINKAKDWLYRVKDWSGATGVTEFDKNGDPIGKSYTIMTVKNNQFVPYE